ncbi:MAG TPA: succinate dehydrogenase, cytochrome b556 subunit [Geminicoccaceae bacterium]|jgi:succinate dehydrogenase / fumarate reductase cytochrome b subunit|nr:succinate dehydrogenase, cytochrome b556 subunit [Geminicoccaceae bacterium]
MAQAGRPLSPYVSIYRWYFTMALSIAHRVTGVGLSVGLLLLAWWLIALAGGPESFATVQAAMDNILGGLVLFGFTLFFFYHTLNGIRHLAWDAGYNLETTAARQSGVWVCIGSGALTLVTWAVLLIAG